MARRTGLSSLRRIGLEMCKMIAFASPIVERIYPGNTALKAALSAANAACEVLVAEINVTLPPGV